MRCRTATAEKTDARRKFSAYKRDAPKAVRQLHVEKGSELEQYVVKVWDDNETSNPRLRPSWFYPKVFELLNGLQITSKSINWFADRLIPLEDDENPSFSIRAGLFLSALINGSKEESFDIIVPQLRKPIINLLYQNRKDVTLHGNVGKWFARQMQDGSANLHGDAGPYLGIEMAGGTVVTYGTVASVGHRQHGGKIIVKGDMRPHSSIGTEMKGGEITIENSLSQHTGMVGTHMQGGRISAGGSFSGEIARAMSGGEISLSGRVIANMGDDMGDGTISLAGYCTAQVGIRQTGGKIHVDGSVNMAGCHMSGGIVEAGDIENPDFAHGMTGGVIYITDPVSDLDITLLRNKVQGGKIYLKGELIVDK